MNVTASAHIKFRCPIFVQDSRDTCEGTTSFGDDGNGAADTTLMFLHLQIDKKNGEDILGTHW